MRFSLENTIVVDGPLYINYAVCVSLQEDYDVIKVTQLDR
jgi:hypothetical protein